ncbi:hypothetical protein SDC9_200511 [bioreactor metagenome]|uniref:Uncharacterized protein n=1 Tax=bioreactor metagenome TaxID=1076179 RepID=A0A645INE5_9ZZZZ
MGRFFGSFLFGKQAEQPSFLASAGGFLVIFRIHRITNGTIGHPSLFFDGYYTRLDIIHIIQSIKNTHDIQSRSNGILKESVDNLIGIRSITV